MKYCSLREGKSSSLKMKCSFFREGKVTLISDETFFPRRRKSHLNLTKGLHREFERPPGALIRPTGGQPKASTRGGAPSPRVCRELCSRVETFDVRPSAEVGPLVTAPLARINAPRAEGLKPSRGVKAVLDLAVPPRPNRRSSTNYVRALRAGRLEMKTSSTQEGKVIFILDEIFFTGERKNHLSLTEGLQSARPQHTNYVRARPSVRAWWNREVERRLNAARQLQAFGSRCVDPRLLLRPQRGSNAPA
jgi:hypothetical protein